MDPLTIEMQMKGLLVNRLLPHVGPRSRSRHIVGLPPELGGNEEENQRLGHPAILTIEQSPRGQVFLYRFSARGDEVGDTWHRTVDEAIQQAEDEYADVLGPWVEVPTGVDALEFGLRSADERNPTQDQSGV